MNNAIRIIVIILGIASLVFGIILVVQTGSGKQQLADELKPLALADVEARYDQVTANQEKMMAAEEPNIQAGKAAPSAMYTYLTVQRTSLGLARTNIGLTGFIQMAGYVNILIGLGLALVGVAAPGKSKA
ncbi:MAG: hypothetical protein Q8O43_10320 [Dehalococcoidia bacterium]|nr:hypothetical protein [Dehalococcoidia bacterium]